MEVHADGGRNEADEENLDQEDNDGKATRGSMHEQTTTTPCCSSNSTVCGCSGDIYYSDNSGGEEGDDEGDDQGDGEAMSEESDGKGG